MSLQNQAVQKAIALLNASQCKFKIITPDGAEFGELIAIIEKPRLKKKSLYPIGTLTNHFTPYLQNLNVSEIGVVPANEFEIEAVRSAISGWCARQWGIGSHMSSINRANNTIEVLRYA